MIGDLGLWVSRWFGRMFPDPFVIAVMLTLFTGAIALAFGDFAGSPAAGSGAGSGAGGGGGAGAQSVVLLDAWRSTGGVWQFLLFGMQMCLVLITGHALAASGPVQRALRAIATVPSGTASAAAITGGVGCVCSVLNWGFGLIAGAILAREVARSLEARGIRAHYPLIVAAGFAGFLPWHGGLSGSAPLSMTTASSMARVLPAETVQLLQNAGYSQGVPLSDTTFSMLNIVVTIGLVVLVPLVVMLLAPKKEQDIVTMAQLAPGRVREEAEEKLDGSGSERSFAEYLDGSRLISTLLGVLALVAFLRFAVVSPQGSSIDNVATNLRTLGLNEFNLLMLGLGLVLHRSPRSYLAAIDDGARGCGGIVVQFPLYGGIVAILVASGLAGRIADAFSDWASPTTLPIWTFASAAGLNMFIPSGGGQWAV